jgi:hypothetical protein
MAEPQAPAAAPAAKAAAKSDKIRCRVTTDNGPRIITGVGEDGKAIRKSTKKGDVIEVTPQQYSAWGHTLQAADAWEAEQKALEASNQAAKKAAEAARAAEKKEPAK